MGHDCCNYFAYGSNMSYVRLKKRVPSAQVLGTYSLKGHRLAFHKSGRDGTAKCDAWETGKNSDCVLGVLYSIKKSEKTLLDAAEGLGNGYDEKEVTLTGCKQESARAFLYYATNINDELSPFSWYVNHVLTGAQKAGLPVHYIEQIKAIDTIEDKDKERDLLERSMYIEIQ